MDEKKIQIFVAAHNQCNYKLARGYDYIRVGKNEFNSKFSDATGDQISDLNPYYCELTAIYWIWKNFHDANAFVGLCHYRRQLSDENHFDVLMKKPISLEKISKYLNEFDILLPQKTYHEFALYDMYDKHDKSHKINDLIVMLNSLQQKHHIPYAESLKFMMNTNSAYYCNMIICKKSIFDDYCTWAFPVLDQVFKEINFDNRNKSEMRVIGYLSERLFNIWLTFHPELKIKELPIIRLDKSHLSNWNKYRKYLRGTLGTL
jgi:hypothetical protein